jgi:hypothetical protein
LFVYFPSKYRVFPLNTNYIFFILPHKKQRVFVLTRLCRNLVCFLFISKYISKIQCVVCILFDFVVVLVSLCKSGWCHADVMLYAVCVACCDSCLVHYVLRGGPLDISWEWVEGGWQIKKKFLQEKSKWNLLSAGSLRGSPCKNRPLEFRKITEFFHTFCVEKVIHKMPIKLTKNADFGIVVSFKFFFAIIFGLVRKHVKTVDIWAFLYLTFISRFYSNFLKLIYFIFPA